jgi:hypothetical protein
MKWSGDSIIYLEKRNKEFTKRLKRLNNIKRKAINNHGRFRYTFGRSHGKDRPNR